MKKLTSKQIFTFVALMGVIILVLVYVFVYKKFTALAEQTRLSNEALQARVNDLKVYYDNEPSYLKDMEEMTPQIDEILAKYPADIREEDLIMHAVITQEVTPVKYSSINFANKSTFSTVDAATVQNAGLDKYQQEISFNEFGVTYPTDLTYLGLKNLVQVIFDSEYNIGINSISYVTGGEGGTEELENGLTGSMQLTFYSATGTGKEYVLPDITPYEAGLSNIFGLENEEELVVETEETETTE